MRKFAFALLLFCCGLMLGQAPGTGNYNFATFDSRGFDSVNVGNLNVRFSIPIVSRTGRGLPFQYNLAYEGLIWAQSSASGTATWVPDPTWGFHGQINNGTGLKGYMTYRTTSVACSNPGFHGRTPPTSRVSNFNYFDEFGRRHAFNYSFEAACELGTPDNDVQTGDGSTSDGSGYSLNTSDYSQVITRSGQVLTVPVTATGQNPTSITDANGNTINGNGSGGFTDTLGVTALTINGTSPRTFTYPVTLQANNATTATATLSYQTYTVQTNFQCSGIVEYGATSASLPNQLTLADGSSYLFSYEPTPNVSGAVTGRLASVTLPTGGVVSYAYRDGCSGAGINADGTIGSLTRTTSDGSRQYNRAPNNGNSTYTDLIDEKGNDTHYVFSIDPISQEFLETHRQVHQGSTNGTILMDQYTCYNNATANCDGGNVALPITEADVTQSFNGGSQVLTKNAYDSNGTLLTDSKIVSAGVTQTELQNTYNAAGFVTVSQNLDPSGNAYTYLVNTYDGSSPIATSGIPQHGTPSSSPGNLTQQLITANSANLVTKTSYYDTGQPASSTGLDGGVTNYGYDSTQGFVTSTTLPTPSSGVALSTSAQFDVNSTAPITSTGMNSDTTRINVYDAVMRPTSVTLPSGSNITISYDSPIQTTVHQSLDSSRTAISVPLKDAYGRLSRMAQFNGQSSNQWYQVDYCYDSTGLLQFQSARYQSTGYNAAKQCSGAGTTYSYDALGRTTSVTTNDGAGQNETVTTTYNNRAVRTTDANNVSKITQYDMLGRISAVCELTSNSYGGQAPGACNTDIAGTGFVTSYAYNLVSHITTISQGGQTRSFQTDSANRPISATEPERGTTSYTYSYNSIGLLVQRNRPQANQTNANTQTTTATQYDLLGRLVSVSYNDNLTPGKYFYYDTAQPSSGWSTAPSNVKGRLAAMATTSNTRAQFSYDIRGNMLTMWQCAPSICGGANQQSRQPLQFTYDLSGAVATAPDVAGTVLTYGRSAAGEVTTVTSSYSSGPNNPTNLVSSVANGPIGPTSWLLASGLYSTKAYDALGRTTADFLCSGSSAVWCPGGSALYGNALQYIGSQVRQVCDSTFGAYCRNTSYDDFNRLTSLTSSEGSNTYSYDRYGNRLTANGVSYSFNASNNRLSNNGYDAAGNQLTDAQHSYTYDAEGKIVQVDGGTSDIFTYDAMDNRVQVVAGGSTTEERTFDFSHRRQGTYVNGTLQQFRVYWDYGLLAHRADNVLYFHQGNYLGTERVRTNPQGHTVSTQSSGPYGENYSQSSTDVYGTFDNSQFTGQEHDTFGGSDSSTDHFLYRQYSEVTGRWMSPDPYDGSYGSGDPQRLNRYTYTSNNPLAYTDPDGLVDYGYDCGDGCVGVNTDGDGYGGASIGISPVYGSGYVSSQSGGSSGTANASLPTFYRPYIPKSSCPSASAQLAAATFLKLTDPGYSAAKRLAEKIDGTVIRQLDAQLSIGIPEAGNFGGSISGQVGIAVDAHGNVAIVMSGSAGLGYGGGAIVGGNVTLSKANYVYDLRGVSGGASVGGGDGPGAAITVTNNGGLSGGVTVGVAIGGYGGSPSAGPTKVIPVVCTGS